MKKTVVILLIFLNDTFKDKNRKQLIYTCDKNNRYDLPLPP